MTYPFFWRNSASWQKKQFPNPCIVAGKSILRAKENATYKNIFAHAKLAKIPEPTKF